MKNIGWKVFGFFFPCSDKLPIPEAIMACAIRWLSWGLAALILGLMIFNPTALTEGNKTFTVLLLIACGAIVPHLIVSLSDNRP